MDLKKRFDHSDINNFLPDNVTLGTEGYYRNKFKNKLPDELYYGFEVLTRKEYNDTHVEQYKSLVLQYRKDFHIKLMSEFEEREKVIESMPDITEINLSS
jgi:hypothetical protein